jgi:hypothetical protein
MRIITVTFATILLLAFLPAQSMQAAKEPTSIEQAAGCSGFNHHQPTHWLSYISSGTVYANIRTGDVIVFIWVEECRNWLVSIWRGWKWRTHFFPTTGLTYIMNEISNARATVTTWHSVSNKVSGGFILAVVPHPCKYNRHLMCPSNE